MTKIGEVFVQQGNFTRREALELMGVQCQIVFTR